MLIDFFLTLRKGQVPVTLRELIDLLQALNKHLVFVNVDQFYTLARTIMVKDERFYDRFDRAFAHFFNGIEDFDDLLAHLIPDDWLRSTFEKQLSDAEKANIQSLQSLEELIETFKKRLAEQKEKHQGGNKWIGTGGTSPFGQGGFNPAGIRVGPNGQHNKAVKVWDKRTFKDLDDDVEVSSRTMSVALRRLRKFARTGQSDELDLPDTIRSTANNGGMLELKMRPERHNAVKVLLFFDVGGSMDPYIKQCEQLFSAARSEFKHLEYFYFHNFIYEAVWQNNYRRQSESTSIIDLTHKYGRDYKVIIVGDASMSPYEIFQPGGSVEHWNDQSGQHWFKKLYQSFDKVAWINPIEQDQWHWTDSIGICAELVEDNMFPMTLSGLEKAMGYLT